MIDAGVARRFNVRIPLRDGVTLSAETDGVIATNQLWHTPSRPPRLILN